MEYSVCSDLPAQTFSLDNTMDMSVVDVCTGDYVGISGIRLNRDICVYLNEFIQNRHLGIYPGLRRISKVPRPLAIKMEAASCQTGTVG